MNKNVSYRINVETKHTRSHLIQIPCLSARAPDPSSWLPVTTCENLPTLSQTVSLRQPQPALNHFWMNFFIIVIKTINMYLRFNIFSHLGSCNWTKVASNSLPMLVVSNGTSMIVWLPSWSNTAPPISFNITGRTRSIIFFRLRGRRGSRTCS